MGEAEHRIELPEGLDWETAHEAVQAVEDWELRADGMAIELVVRLYEVLIATRGRIGEAR